MEQITDFEYRKAALDAAVRVFHVVQSIDVIKLAFNLEQYLRAGENTQE